MKYSDLIKVNENFQYSVNLQFDLNNIEKIKNYIPTKDGCDVLKIYIKSIISGKNRATTLIGPYGKGKSHLLLVLLMLISDYNSEDANEINNLINKIGDVDSELYEMLLTLRKEKIKLLPVIINSNYNDLNQAFLLGIHDALDRENISNVVTSTYYDVALSTIEDWEENYTDIKDDIVKCLKNANTDMKELKKGLKLYNLDSLELFNEVYRCITRGQIFNPLVNSDIVKNYKDICYELEKKEYNGLFIAFDEFSKFLESTESNHIMHDLKILQDFAELAERTGKHEQIHISCITHKGISEYLDNNNEDKINAFKTVEGRFKNIYFNRSMEQNYQIVSHTLKKEKEFSKYYEKYIEDNAIYYLNVKDMNVFKNTDNLERDLFKGCFPLNPVTTYSLIELSEKIAQNERTLFTFLADDDNDSLKTFINTSSTGLFNLDKVYDYFEGIFKSTSDSNIRGYWIKATNSLKKNLSNNCIKIIKAMAIIYMINNLEEICPDDNTLKVALVLSDDDYKKAIDELLEKSVIRRKKITEELDFATSYSKKLTNEIKELVSTQFDDINEKEVLQEIIGKYYSLPRRYNEEYKMTRFFQNVFISENELMNLTDFSVIYENNYTDGIILNLIRTSKNINELINHFEDISDNKTILKISKISYSKKFLNLLKEYDAITYLMNQNDYTEEEKSELVFMKNEVENAVKDSYKYYSSSENTQEYRYQKKSYKNVQNVSSLLSSICEEVYSKTPIVNNELINKGELSAPIKKARGIVIDTILTNNFNLISSKTSAEATIYKAIVDKKETSSIKNILNLMNEFVRASDGKRKSFDDLYKVLLKEPYSIRKGIIPVLLAMTLSDFSENIILYYMNREIDLDSVNLVKINDNPSNYYILTESGTADKINYVTEMMNIFNVKNDSDNLRINVHHLVESMKKWILSLPRIIRESNISNKSNLITEEQIEIKSELLRPDLNNNEFLFDTIIKIFQTDDYNIICKKTLEMYDGFNNFINDYKEIVLKETIELFDKNYKGSLSTLIREWNNDLNPKVKNKIFDIKTKDFLNYLLNLDTHNDDEILNNFAKIITGFYIEDWQPNQNEEYINSFKEVIGKLKVETADNQEDMQKIILSSGDKIIEKDISSSDNISSLGMTLKNNIEEIIDEYGGSLPEEEKMNVLLDIIKKFM